MKDLFELKREFLEYCELDKGQSVLTIANYDRYLSKFLDWLKLRKTANPQIDNGLIDSRQQKDQELNVCRPPSIDANNDSSALLPADIDQEAVREYRLYVNRLGDRNGRELKKNTQNYHLLALRAFLKYLAFRSIPSLSPEKVSIAKIGDRQITFLKSEELDMMLKAGEPKARSSLRDRTILEVLFSTGLRVSELAALSIFDLSFERGEIAILGKGKKVRIVFLSESALGWIKKYLGARGADRSDDSPLFLSNRGERLTVRSIERVVEKAAKVAGITKNVSPHTLRHSFATDLLMSGADIRSVQSLLGHSSVATTQIYTHVTDQHLREVHQTFHGKSLNQDDQLKTDKH